MGSRGEVGRGEPEREDHLCVPGLHFDLSPPLPPLPTPLVRPLNTKPRRIGYLYVLPTPLPQPRIFTSNPSSIVLFDRLESVVFKVRSGLILRDPTSVDSYSRVSLFSKRVGEVYPRVLGRGMIRV